MTQAAAPLLSPPTKPFGQQVFDFVLWGGIILLLISSFGSAEIAKFPLLFSNSENMRQFASGFVNPDFSNWRDLIEKMWLTIQMAIWGTALAILFAVPMGLLGARNVTPAFIQLPVRRLMDLIRSVPDLVIGTAFLVAVGLGPFAGVMALALNTGGVLAKLFAEAVEAIDKGPVEGVRATGAARLQEIVWGVIPQVAPLWTSYALYRFESNSRSATVLGLIGAGGIGQILFDSMNSFNYALTAAISIVIVVAVTLIDLLSQTIRARLL
ncbi:MAG: phosphonate ABC transporter, permease protein PhnE [Phenylobacterium sp.]|uniref:phosphonate ABC transporter, permease protein PhnE n=1 Tax=Phenylobacterium sp. TaxID=1871053 RepID=UPI0025F42A1E|nr:phosphonate ABC transporter, permease protein PhnE [Phenylobacterium sp.]MCA6225420.1 phosphonate ABC transporter, permease protein PhnE [Phenylobacterium sp.]MCA6233046.1 phosphonate ABC transporter, permease protein PhnE [Phenylobacterium sp.]MCA6234972.1 phosphonate ABC transporter, permease protein PhnE [Phenylobacterium sp.]MCA6250036.1 phosphonate ABC transporter, permease protein PhnE [Phenylobacterium sp.]MCA6251385.1 phosphonate ABC transporter, permease protein PhnE [Phenylobacter